MPIKNRPFGIKQNSFLIHLLLLTTYYGDKLIVKSNKNTGNYNYNTFNNNSINGTIIIRKKSCNTVCFILPD